MEKTVPSGITYTDGEGNTVTLEEFVEQKKGEEVHGERIEAERVSKYHKPRVRVTGKGSRRVLRTVIYPQREINKMNWENELKSAVKHGDTTRAVLAVISSGGSFTIQQWLKVVWNEDLKEVYISKRKTNFKIRYVVNKSPVRHLIAVDKSEKANVYQLMNVAKDLSLKDLLLIYYKNSPEEERLDVFNRHPDVANLVNAGEGVKGKKDKRKIVVEKEEEKLSDEQFSLGLKTTLERTLSDFLGVEVSGKVDINVNINFNIR